MKRINSWSAALAALLLSPVALHAATVAGTVNNGTTGQPAAGVEIILLQLQGGMQPVANTKTDAGGRFTLDHAGIGTQPMLVRAVYKGVNFHQALPPGKNAISLDVFEPTQDAKTITVPSHVVIFQPNGGSLTVGEEYSVKNDARPPQAYFRPDGNFEVALPEKSELKQIAAAGPSGMPVVQAPIDKGRNRYAIAFAFRPGESEVRLSYELPYPNSAATVKLPTSYTGGRLLVVAPPGVHLTGDGLEMAGQEAGMNIYERAAPAAGSFLTVGLSGSAPPPSAGRNPAGAPGRAENVQGGESGPEIQSVPGRLDPLKWPLIGGFCVLFVLAAVLLARKPVAVAVELKEAPGAGPTAGPSSSAAPAPSPNQATLAAMDLATASNLETLKDQLFRLELRRQAGTISEEDYRRERAKADQLLRDLVRG
jgi:hypothetical protein